MNELVYALTLFLLQPSPGPVHGVEPRAWYELAVYDSRAECTITAGAVRVKATGARLRCVPRERTPEEKREIAVLREWWARGWW